jgi:hypothetical protein
MNQPVVSCKSESNGGNICPMTVNVNNVCVVPRDINLYLRQQRFSSQVINRGRRILNPKRSDRVKSFGRNHVASPSRAFILHLSRFFVLGFNPYQNNPTLVQR